MISLPTREVPGGNAEAPRFSGLQNFSFFEGVPRPCDTDPLERRATLPAGFLGWEATNLRFWKAAELRSSAGAEEPIHWPWPRLPWTGGGDQSCKRD